MTTSEKIAIAGIAVSAVVSIVTTLISRHAPSEKPASPVELRAVSPAPTIISLVKLVLLAIIIVALVEGGFNIYAAVLSFHESQRAASTLPYLAVSAGCVTVLIIALTVRKRLRAIG